MNWLQKIFSKKKEQPYGIILADKYPYNLQMPTEDYWKAELVVNKRHKWYLSVGTLKMGEYEPHGEKIVKYSLHEDGKLLSGWWYTLSDRKDATPYGPIASLIWCEVVPQSGFNFNFLLNEITRQIFHNS